jgi:hypothetical protein
MAAVLQLCEGEIEHRAVLGFHDEEQRRYTVDGQHLDNLHDS